MSNSPMYFEFKKNFVWNTHDGQRLKIKSMNTIHIFNSLKMVYNNILAEYTDVNEVWYNVKWSLNTNQYLSYLLSMVVFVEEIERRDNLPVKYAEPYYRILLELMCLDDKTTNKLLNKEKNSGKWLIFSNNNNIDMLWMKIKKATEKGLLGRFSKVATAKPNSNAPNSDMKVICVYTYDYKDIYDVFRIRAELRKLGIIQAIPYKTDLNTLKGKYAVKGNKRISTYYE